MQEVLFRRVWVGEFGEYEIPREFAHVKISKQGWPDLRCKDAVRFLEWAAKVDQDAKEAKEA